MSKNTTFLKKNNPLAIVINKQPQGYPSTRKNTNFALNNSSAQQDINTKLYTFCQHDNKNQPSPNDENIPLNRERKVSLNNNLKSQPQTKSISKIGQMININKEKKSKNNMSLASINVINSSFDRRKTQKSNTARFEERKVNISISINPKTMREIQSSQQKQEENEKRKSQKNDKNWWQLRRQQKNNPNPLLKQKQSEEKKKIVIEEEELEKFTKKFAHQKCILEEKIAQYQSRLTEWQQAEKQWQTQRRDMSEYINFLQQQKSQRQSEIANIKSSLAVLKNDNEYYIIAKDQARKVIKDQQIEITNLYNQIDQLKNQVKIARESRYSSTQSKNDTQKQLKNRLKLVEIENNHLLNEKAILLKQNEMLLLKQSSSDERRVFEDKINILMERNNQLKSALKDALTGQISADVYTKTIQDLSESIVKLKQQNKSLKNKLQYELVSVHQHSTDQSRFQFKLDSTSRKIDSPSQVQFVWRRENNEEGFKDLNNQQIALFDVGLFPKGQLYKNLAGRASDL